jgi:hypothetical protein
LDRIDLAVEKAAEGGSVDFDVDQLDLDALVGEETLLLGDEERPVADPDEVGDAQRLGVREAHENQPDCRCQAAKTKPNSHFSASQSEIGNMLGLS